MPSPFPGMNPYLEDLAFWQDFHATFLNYWREAIADRLPEAYEARIGERVVLETIEDEEDEGGRPSRRIEPDVAIHRTGREPGGGLAVAEGVATLEPTTLPLPRKFRARRTSLEIRRRPGRELVTVLELLSPSNKGSDRVDYLNRREDLLAQGVHLVELDLPLGGERVDPPRPLPPGDYYCLVTRAGDPSMCSIYTWRLRDPLPKLPVPLKAPDPSILIDYAAVFATAFDRGRYVRSLDYGQPPTAPICEEDRGWVIERAGAVPR